MKNIIKNSIKEVLSGLWTILTINMIFNDIFTIMVELDKWQRPDFLADAKTLMLIAAFVTNIPIMMIFLSRFLQYKINRWLNIFVGIFTIIYVWGGMMSYPHYIAVASIETILAFFIISIAWKWKN
jgi:uncharacterized membrane protein HdeD (DUF308 family)